MLALESGGSLLRTGDADTEADLVVGNIVHPFLVEDVLTGNVGGDVTADGVAHVGSTVRVELTTFVTGNETDLGKVTKRHELNVEGSLDKVSTCHGSVGLKCEKDSVQRSTRGVSSLDARREKGLKSASERGQLTITRALLRGFVQ